MLLRAAWIILLSSSVIAADPIGNLPLNRFPFVRAHDAATGYLQVPSWLKPEERITYEWAKTQDGNITSMLACGVRNFDWRPKADNNGRLVMHHGGVEIPHPMEDVLTEVSKWANLNTNGSQDLVLLDVWDCWGPNCQDLTTAALRVAGIPLITDCNELYKLTVDGALAQSKLAGGGHVLAHYCNDDPPGWSTYDESLSCLGFKDNDEGVKFRNEIKSCISVGKLAESNEGLTARHSYIDWPKVMKCARTIPGILDSSAHYSCYTGSSTRNIAIGELRAWTANLTSLSPPVDTTGKLHYLFRIVGAWSENEESVVLGFLHGSSLLDEERKSALNSEVARWVADGTMATLPNILGVNNACHGGEELRKALQIRLQDELHAGASEATRAEVLV